MTLLREILNMTPLPVKWQSNTQARFVMSDETYGILLEVQELTLPSRKIDICNVSFGRLKDDKKDVSEDNLDRSLTNKGQTRTVLSTVANACVANNTVLNSDIVVLAGADQAREKRANIYLLGISELSNAIKSQFKHTLRFKLGNAQVVALSKIDFDDEELNFITSNLDIQK